MSTMRWIAEKTMQVSLIPYILTLIEITFCAFFCFLPMFGNWKLKEIWHTSTRFCRHELLEKKGQIGEREQKSEWGEKERNRWRGRQNGVSEGGGESLWGSASEILESFSSSSALPRSFSFSLPSSSAAVKLCFLTEALQVSGKDTYTQLHTVGGAPSSAL